MSLGSCMELDVAWSWSWARRCREEDATSALLALLTVKRRAGIRVRAAASSAGIEGGGGRAHTAHRRGRLQR